MARRVSLPSPVYGFLAAAVVTAVRAQTDAAVTTCFSDADIVGSVLGTFFSTLAVVAIGFLVYWFVCRTKREHAQLSKPLAKDVEAHAYDNPYFQEDEPDRAPPVESDKGNSSPLAAKISNSSDNKAVSTDGGNKKAKTQKSNPFNVFSNSKGHPQRSLDDSFINQEPEKLEVKLRGSDFTGLGFNIYGNMRDGIYVKDVLHRGPASESGKIRAGDRILAVRVSFEQITIEDALTILSYASPYDVALELQKTSDQQPFMPGHQKKGSTASSASGSVGVGLGAGGDHHHRLAHPVYRSQSTSDVSHLNRDGAAAKRSLSGGVQSRAKKPDSLKRQSSAAQKSIEESAIPQESALPPSNSEDGSDSSKHQRFLVRKVSDTRQSSSSSGSTHGKAETRAVVHSADDDTVIEMGDVPPPKENAATPKGSAKGHLKKLAGQIEDVVKDVFGAFSSADSQNPDAQKEDDKMVTKDASVSNGAPANPFDIRVKIPGSARNSQVAKSASPPIAVVAVSDGNTKSNEISALALNGETSIDMNPIKISGKRTEPDASVYLTMPPTTAVILNGPNELASDNGNTTTEHELMTKLPTETNIPSNISNFDDSTKMSSMYAGINGPSENVELYSLKLGSKRDSAMAGFSDEVEKSVRDIEKLKTIRFNDVAIDVLEDVPLSIDTVKSDSNLPSHDSSVGNSTSPLTVPKLEMKISNMENGFVASNESFINSSSTTISASETYKLNDSVSHKLPDVSTNGNDDFMNGPIILPPLHYETPQDQMEVAMMTIPKSQPFKLGNIGKVEAVDSSPPGTAMIFKNNALDTDESFPKLLQHNIILNQQSSPVEMTLRSTSNSIDSTVVHLPRIDIKTPSAADFLSDKATVDAEINGNGTISPSGKVKAPLPPPLSIKGEAVSPIMDPTLNDNIMYFETKMQSALQKSPKVKPKRIAILPGKRKAPLPPTPTASSPEQITSPPPPNDGSLSGPRVNEGSKSMFQYELADTNPFKVSPKNLERNDDDSAVVFTKSDNVTTVRVTPRTNPFPLSTKATRVLSSDDLKPPTNKIISDGGTGFQFSSFKSANFFEGLDKAGHEDNHLVQHKMGNERFNSIPRAGIYPQRNSQLQTARSNPRRSSSLGDLTKLQAAVADLPLERAVSMDLSQPEVAPVGQFGDQQSHRDPSNDETSNQGSGGISNSKSDYTDSWEHLANHQSSQDDEVAEKREKPFSERNSHQNQDLEQWIEEKATVKQTNKRFNIIQGLFKKDKGSSKKKEDKEIVNKKSKIPVPKTTIHIGDDKTIVSIERNPDPIHAEESVLAKDNVKNHKDSLSDNSLTDKDLSESYSSLSETSAEGEKPPQKMMIAVDPSVPEMYDSDSDSQESDEQNASWDVNNTISVAVSQLPTSNADGLWLSSAQIQVSDCNKSPRMTTRRSASPQGNVVTIPVIPPIITARDGLRSPSRNEQEPEREFVNNETGENCGGNSPPPNQVRLSGPVRSLSPTKFPHPNNWPFDNAIEKKQNGEHDSHTYTSGNNTSYRYTVNYHPDGDSQTLEADPVTVTTMHVTVANVSSTKNSNISPAETYSPEGTISKAVIISSPQISMHFQPSTHSTSPDSPPPTLQPAE